jgi:nicotinamide riboside kinase
VKIALLGAESTGKSTLSHDLAAHLRRDDRAVAIVPEVLREWCEREHREPRPEEHLAIAQEQEARVEAAAAGADIVVADTTALMVAIYAGILFTDHPLLQFALERQRGYHLTLVTGLDLPWVDDGLQRAADSRERVDELVRTLLAGARIAYRVVYGAGRDRLRNALAALPVGLAPAPVGDPASLRAWKWQCDKCSDPECEHRLFTSLVR